MYEIGKHYSLNKIFYACVIMVCFAACVNRFVRKKGEKRTKKRDNTHTHSFALFVGLAWLLVKNGVSAFFVVVVL